MSENTVRPSTVPYRPRAAGRIRGVRKRAFHTLSAICLLMLMAGAGHAQPYQIINTETSVVGDGLEKTVTTVQVGDNPVNRFLMSRVAKPVPSHALKGALLIAPPLGSGFQNYEVGENGDYNKSFVAYFASRNIAVYGISQRAQDIMAGACESGAVDCSAMADWGIQALLDDFTFARQQIELEHPDLDVVAAGLSLGSMLAIAAINAHPDDYAGAILIDGTLYDEDPAVRALNANFRDAFDDLLANGVFYDGQSGPGFKLLSQLAETDPDAPTPLPGFPPGLTSHQAFVLALSEPPPSPMTFRPGYFSLAGSVAEDRFFFANESLVHANIAQFIDYAAVRTLRDIYAGLAGDQTFTNNLHSFTGPVLMFAAGHGFGPGMIDTAQLMTSADVTINFKGEYGHVDYVFSTNHVEELEHPIIKWLSKEVFKK